MTWTKRKAAIIHLTPHELEALNKLAAEFRTLSPHGPTAGKPTFRVLLHEIAAGRIKLSR